ncbi:ROP interactive partner 5 isoform 4 [Hibiscus syriacus]|uniref:ROP interactive partner 5 isoform 4 n=1 Tax=Hibiscus syriacus TaxID=106335 RepID=A0A6A3D1T5_HIBSY|nr:ROP interactive partner 5 isoform 4 [Hibiscus syriacus]
MVAESEAAQTKQAESAHSELQSLKEKLVETHSLVENMKNSLRIARNQKLGPNQGRMKLGYNWKLQKRLLKHLGLVNKLKAAMTGAGGSISIEPDGNCIAVDHQAGENKKPEESCQLEAEISSLKSEVTRLRSALKTAETKCHAEETQGTIEIKSAHGLVEQIKSEASSRETELLAELEKANISITDLKANMMDKETELQCISEENDELRMKLEKTMSRQRESELEKELNLLNETIVDLKANMMDKETELQNISEENEMLRLEINKRDSDKGKTNELDEARAAEREAIMKLGLAMEEADKNNRRAARVAEQLEAAQTANSEMETELRTLKVQSNQWRKAAEAAASMLSAGNNGKFMERTGSLDINYDPVKGRVGLPYTDDLDDELLKKKHGNMLKKIGVLWKKPQK